MTNVTIDSSPHILSLSACGTKVRHVIDYLSNIQLDLSNCHTYRGTSSGAVLAFFLSIGIDIDFLNNEYEINDPTNHFHPSGLTLLTTMGMDNMSDFCKEITRLSSGLSNMTFGELFDTTGRKLEIFCTDLTHMKTARMNYINSYDIKVIYAIKASCSIPIIFEPTIIGNCVYIDGAFMNPFPYFDEPNELGILVNTEYDILPANILNMKSYLIRLSQLATQVINNTYILTEYYGEIINIYVDDELGFFQL